jgi:biopolymer transport protein ExbB
MVEFLVSGGPLMVPIVLCSVVSVAVVLERLWALRVARVLPAGFAQEAIARARQGRVEDLAALLSGSRSVAARIGRIVVEERADPMVRDARLAEAGRREAAELERYCAIVGTCASIGPLLGLLGTVQGMIATFATVSSGGIGDMAALAGGIGVALVTTFGGLAVAIPAVVGDRYLLGRVDDRVLELEEWTSALVRAYDEGQQGGVP